MKILYIGNYRDTPSGWGNATKDYILALDSVGVDVVPRPIRLSQERKTDLPERVVELENNSPENCDAVIIQTLPHLYDKPSSVPHVGMFCSETTNFLTSSWSERCNIMDHLIVMNPQGVMAAKESSVTTPVSVVPVPTDISKFEQSYDKLDIPEIQDTFNFYFVGESVHRKNIGALIKAFHLEFGVDEPVNLVIKTSLPGAGPEESLNNIKEKINAIKGGLKTWPNNTYKREVIITNHLSEEQMMQLHNTCDCFVAPSFGEAWCIPAFDAMGMGNPVIATDCTAFPSYVDKDTGILVPSRETPVFGMTNTFGDLYTGRENWWEIDVAHLRKSMRYMYENKSYYSALSENCRRKAYEFTYETVGQNMKQVLESIIN